MGHLALAVLLLAGGAGLLRSLAHAAPVVFPYRHSDTSDLPAGHARRLLDDAVILPVHGSLRDVSPASRFPRGTRRGLRNLCLRVPITRCALLRS